MKIANSETTAFTPPPTVRGGRIDFKTLLEGRPGTPHNYQLLLADTDISFKSPRHRHNFDQLRYSVRGPTHTGDDCVIGEGELAYFPEGCYYGPQDQSRCKASSLTMVIQFGGPSGNGYISRAEMENAFDELSRSGDFEQGVYKRRSPGAGEKKNQDAYEAIWEHHNRRTLIYPKPRFATPVRFSEAHFDWAPDPKTAGLWHKHIATLTEAHLSLAFLKMEAGQSHSLTSGTRTRLVFVKSGTGSVGTTGSWSPHTAMHLDPGESIMLLANSESEMLLVDLPVLK